MLEMLSSLYNYAVALARQACVMSLEGEGIADASSIFQQASWVFEHLLTLVEALPEIERSLDFTRETLTMNSNLCLGNAQGLVRKKAIEQKLNNEILSRISK